MGEEKEDAKEKLIFQVFLLLQNSINPRPPLPPAPDPTMKKGKRSTISLRADMMAKIAPIFSFFFLRTFFIICKWKTKILFISSWISSPFLFISNPMHQKDTIKRTAGFGKMAFFVRNPDEFWVKARSENKANPFMVVNLNAKDGMGWDGMTAPLAAAFYQVDRVREVGECLKKWDTIAARLGGPASNLWGFPAFFMSARGNGR